MNIKTLITALVVIGMAATLQAGAVTFTDTYDPADVYLWESNPTVSFTHNILDDGFDPSQDVLVDANIELWVIDNALEQERVNVSLDGFSAGTYEVGLTSLNLTVYVTLLQQDGKLDVVLTRMCGEYWFQKSVLTATGFDCKDNICTVPVPGALVLLAAGLAGVGTMSLRKRR